MTQRTSPLDNMSIASPCDASWEAMVGDDTARHCLQCQMNVYNLSAMSRSEAEALIESHEGRLCVRYYQRPDGTVLTKDCPVGLQRRFSKTLQVRRAGIAAAVLVVALAGVGFAKSTQSEQDKPILLTGAMEPLEAIRDREIMGERVVPIQPTVEPKTPGETEKPHVTMGKVVQPKDTPVVPAVMGTPVIQPPPQPVMGSVVPNPPQPPETESKPEKP